MVKSLTPINPADNVLMEKITEYVSLSELYLKNANDMIRKKEYSKAGEMVWGAVATIIKAIGILYGRRTKNHREIIDLAKSISLQLNDKELLEGIVKYAQGFHANYYENFIEPEFFTDYYEKSISAYNKLIAILFKKVPLSSS